MDGLILILTSGLGFLLLHLFLCFSAGFAMGFQEHYFCLGGMKEVIKIFSSVICLVLESLTASPLKALLALQCICSWQRQSSWVGDIKLLMLVNLKLWFNSFESCIFSSGPPWRCPSTPKSAIIAWGCKFSRAWIISPHRFVCVFPKGSDPTLRQLEQHMLCVTAISYMEVGNRKRDFIFLGFYFL